MRSARLRRPFLEKEGGHVEADESEEQRKHDLACAFCERETRQEAEEREQDAAGHELLGGQPPGRSRAVELRIDVVGRSSLLQIFRWTRTSSADRRGSNTDSRAAPSGGPSRRRRGGWRTASSALRRSRSAARRGRVSLKRAEREAGDSCDEKDDHGQYLTETMRLRNRDPIAIEVKQMPTSICPPEVVYSGVM